MSYVRWSSDNFKSDVYAYESDAGFEIIVASGRYVDIENAPQISSYPVGGSQKELDEYWRIYEKQSEWLDGRETEPIGGPHDGETFIFDTEKEMFDFFVVLKDAGYHVPDYLFD